MGECGWHSEDYFGDIEWDDCPSCMGEGRVPVLEEADTECPVCDGSGLQAKGMACPACDKTGIAGGAA